MSARILVVDDLEANRRLLEALLTADDAVDATLYVKVMEKVVEKGSTYVSTELKRVTGMAEADSVSPAKKTLFQRRMNVLTAFTESV